MTYAQQVAAAADLDDKAVRTGLRALANHPQFPAVIAWLERNRTGWVAAVSAQTLADSHGRLAHAAGSLHALETLRGQLTVALAGAKPPAD